MSRRLAVAAAFLAALLSAASAFAQDQSAAPAAPSAAVQSAAPVAPATTTSALLPADLTPWGMFSSADVIVKAVIVILLALSVVTWTIWLAKTIELRAARRREVAALDLIAEARNLDQAVARTVDPPGAVSHMVRAAQEELANGGDETAARNRVGDRLDHILLRTRRAAARHIGHLATIGATSPFIGLFGTVWGIMNSFVGIARTQTTNLAVVAPGIAEALLATACGLVAAIPAVVIYNHFVRKIGEYRNVLEDAEAEILRLVGRATTPRGEE